MIKIECTTQYEGDVVLVEILKMARELIYYHDDFETAEALTNRAYNEARAKAWPDLDELERDYRWTIGSIKDRRGNEALGHLSGLEETMHRGVLQRLVSCACECQKGG